LCRGEEEEQLGERRRRRGDDPAMGCREAEARSTRRQQLGREASAGHVGLAGEEEQLGEEAARNFDI